MRKHKLATAVASLLGGAMLLGATTASAYDAGDTIIRVGIASVQPDASSTELALDGAAIAGSFADVKGNEQLGLTFTYMLTSNWGLEVLASTPFDHDITADTGALGLGVINAGSTKHLPPTISLQYFPMDGSSDFQPYVGLGVNYTKFFSENVATDLQGVLGNGTLDLDASIGLAAQIGMDYRISDKWQLNAAIWFADIETDATFRFEGGAVLTTDVAIDPIVPMVSLSYKL